MADSGGSGGSTPAPAPRLDSSALIDSSGTLPDVTSASYASTGPDGGCTTNSATANTSAVSATVSGTISATSVSTVTPAASAGLLSTTTAPSSGAGSLTAQPASQPPGAVTSTALISSAGSYRGLPAPASLFVPASLADITRGAVLEQRTDGIACPVAVTHFDVTELVELDVLLGGHAVHNILQPLSDLGLPAPDLTDPMTRVRGEREALPLMHCYGVEGFARRALNTARYLQHTTQQVRRLRDQRPSPSDAAQVARLAGKVNSLTIQLRQQRERHVAEIREVKTKHAQHPGTSGVASTSGTTIPALQAEISRLRAESQALTQERDQRAQDAQVWRREAEDTRGVLDDLERQIGSSCIFSARGCMNFLMEHVTFSGYWPRLLELLEDYQHGRPPAADARTSMSISARNLPTDDCVAFTPLEEKASVPGSNSGSPALLSSGQAAQALSSLAQGASAPATPTAQPPTPNKPTPPSPSVPNRTPSSSAPSTPGKTSGTSGRKPPRLLLPAALAPSGSKKSGGKTLGLRLSPSQPKGRSRSQAGARPTPSASSPVVDLTTSSPSASASSVTKPHSERIALARRPRVYTPERVRALSKSSVTKSEADIVLHLPGSMDRGDVRADVWELLLAGEDFWGAVADLQQSKVQHNRFGKRPLVVMLVSMIYWEQLDSTPWSSFVPEVYYDAAVKRIRDPPNDSVPAHWNSLPVRPASSDEDSLLYYFSSDFDDDDEDSNDEDFRGKVAKTKSPVQTRSQKQQQGHPSAGGKRPRGSSSPTSGSRSKRSRQHASLSPSRQLGSSFMDVIEVPQVGRVSWTHYDIKVQRVNDQTVGFPSYTACRNGIAALHARWDPYDYLELLETLPWDQLWKGRVTTFIFFRRSDLSAELLQGIQVVIVFMFVWRQHYWERLHWVTMTSDYAFDADLRFAKLPASKQDALRGLYKDRKDRASDFAAKKRALVAQLEKIPGYQSDIWYEPGLWVVPAATCDWILHSPQAHMPLPEQLAELDEREPARTQWATRRSDNAFFNVVPRPILSKLMSDHERAANLLPELVLNE